MKPRIWAALASLLILPAQMRPQTSISPFDGYTPGSVMPGAPPGSIPLSSFETLNPATASISVNIPLFMVHARGDVTVPVSVPVTSSQVWDATANQYQYNCNQYGCQTGYGYLVLSVGWNPLPPQLGAGRMLFRAAGDYCVGSGAAEHWNSALTRATYVAPDGTETEFTDQLTNGTPVAGNTGYSRGTIFWSDDGAFSKFVASANVQDPTTCGSKIWAANGILTMRDGTNYTLTNGYVTSIRDRNGNLTTISSTSITDSIGRVYSITNNQVQYPGTGGAQRTITIQHNLLDQVLAPGESIQTIGQLWPGIPSSAQGSNVAQNYDPPDRISEIDLPNGTKYSFTYRSYGDVAQITLPSGGVIQYDYTSALQQVATSPVPSYVLNRYLVERREYLAGALISRTHLGANEIDTYDGSNHLLTKQTFSIASSGTPPTYGTNYNPAQYNQATQVKYYDTDGTTVLQTVDNVWTQQNCKVNCRTVQTVTTTKNGVIKKTVFTYDQYNNVTDQQDFDYGAPSTTIIDTETKTAYVTSTSGYNYVGANILNLPSSIQIYDGSGNLYASTTLGYDEYGNPASPLYNCSGIIGHDNQNFAGGAARGNATSITQLVSPGTYATSHQSFDIAGNLIAATDANNHTTFFFHNDNFPEGNRNTYGFVTQVQNALGQLTYQAQYDYSTGQPNITADAAGQQTAYFWSGSGYGIDRLQQVNSPNGGHAFYSYPDPLTVVAQQDQVTPGDGALKTQTRYDGFGRQSETDQFENGSQYIATVQTYDALGRISTVTNPYRTTGDATYGVTSYTYDGLGRTKTATTSDGAIAYHDYSGNTMTVTDQAGRKITYGNDGLERVHYVQEDPTGVNYWTYYGYDPLGDLVSVNQGSLARTFAYDAMGRLKAAANPESGTVTYTYDSAGNTQTRTDARGITTTYAYDALNRIQSISYSDGTPAVYYGYDAPNVTNSAGRLTGIANGNSATYYTAFDAMGNVLASRQLTAGQTFPFSYTYNLAGALTSETYPSGRKLTTGYDGANRAATVTGQLGTTTTNYVTQAAYWPQGALYYFTRGNGVWHAEGYNNRLQPTEFYEAANNSMASMLSVSCLNWGVQPNYGAVLYGLCPAGSATNDNGTLQSATFKAGGPGYPQFLVMNQSFNYDKLNRLTSASDSGGWSRTFNYDQTGNMWVTNPVGGPWSGSTPTTNAFTNNRINGASYDLSGNQLVVNGDTLTYDAENRQSAATDNTTHVTQKYLYDGAGQRVQKTITGGVTTVYVFDAFGALAAEYSTGSNAMTCTTCYPAWDHLGSTRMLMDQNANVIARHDYLPFGEEIQANTVGRNSQWGPLNDTVAQKFTGQTRDSETATDFFNARYFGPALGRFTSPDPANAGADIMNPQSWNAYAYVLGNPLNTVDPSGMCGGIVAGISSDPYHGGGRALLQIAAQYGYDVAYPYAGQSKLAGIFSVFGQSLGFKNRATAVAGAMVQDVAAQTAETGGSSFFGPWSGGAVSTQLAGVSANDSSSYQVYFSPGGALLPTNNSNALVFSGSGVLDTLVNATSSGPLGSADPSYPGSAGCGHDAACMWNSNQAQINGLLTNGNIPPVQSCPNPTVFLPHGVTIPLKSFFPGGGGGGASAGGSGGGWIFQPVYGEEGNFIGGSWLPIGMPHPQPLRPL